MQRIYTMVPAGAFVISSMHSLSTTPLITLPRFPLLEFLNDTSVHMQVEVLNIGTFKILNFLNQKF